MDNVNIINKNDCTGCGSCFNACPCSAIKMMENNEGFLFPVIDSTKCIECGLCYSRCPVSKSAGELLDTLADCKNSPRCFAFQNIDRDIVKNSSSGGAFSALAEYFLDNGGYVCGAAYSSDNISVSHCIISNKEDLKKLRCSKYVQSDTKLVYRSIKKLLNNNEKVLFVGCPCQCAALRMFLSKNYDNLLIVDIVCHGVPSKKVLEKYIDDLNYFSLPKQINFRKKDNFGWTPTFYAKFMNGKEFYKPKWESTYYNPFLKGMCCRLSCGNCKFNKLPRIGDITLGDFWGIEKHDEDFIDNEGTSLVLLNNSKGCEYYEALLERASKMKEENIEYLKDENWNVFGSSKTSPNRERFFTLYKKYDFDTALKRIEHRHFEVGVVGWWYGKNYGSALTYFALNRVLVEMGYDVLMLDWPFIGSRHETNGRMLASQFYQTSYQRSFENQKELNNYIDVFMIGSDQMWNWWDQKDMGYYYFLDFVDDSHPKISYSTSFGHPIESYAAPHDVLVHQSALLKRFSAISVRENDGLEILKQKFDVDGTQTIDPVFLLDKSHYFDLVRDVQKIKQKPYLFCYILTPTAEKGKILKEMANKLNLELVVCLDSQYSFEDNKEKLNLNSVYCQPDVKEWLSLIINSDFVITDSYHGVCFSLLFQKQFLCMINNQRGISRFESLFNLLEIDNIAFENLEDILNYDLSNTINYKKVNQILEEEVKFSKQWLSKVLDNAFRSIKKN